MNENECHLLIFGNKEEEVTVNISGSLIKERDEKNFLGVKLDKKLSFKTHVNNICKKASQKLMHWHGCQDIWKSHSWN